MSTPNISLMGVVPVANGGTGSATKNFIDLTTDARSCTDAQEHVATRGTRSTKERTPCASCAFLWI